MIVHVAFEVSDLARSARFYDAVFYALGARRMFESDGAVAYGHDHEQFWIVARGRGPAPDYGHVALAASGRAAVDGAHAAGIANGGSDDDCAAFAIAISEACANSIEHAYGPEDATIQVRATLVDGMTSVRIRDYGRWRKPRAGTRGRGIPIMREFMDDVSIERAEEGTTVTLGRRLGEER